MVLVCSTTSSKGDGMTNDFDFSFDIDQIEIILRYNIFETGCEKSTNKQSMPVQSMLCSLIEISNFGEIKWPDMNLKVYTFKCDLK